MNHRLAILGACFVYAVGWGALSVPAQDGLYAPSVPTDAALVRVVNLQSHSASPRLDMGSVRFSPVAAGEVVPYRPVAPGIYIIGGRAAGVEFFPESGEFYTVVVAPDGSLTILADEAHRDPARAQIVLFNFSGEAVDLVSVAPAAPIFTGVQSGTARSVAVNAISVDLAAQAGGADLFRQRLQLERGESYGVFIGRDRVFLQAAAVTTE